MILDLRLDYAEFYSHLADRISGFSPTGADVFGGRGPVKMIEIGYEYDQNAWVVVAFDTRPKAEPDGEWTRVIDGNELNRPLWLEAGNAIQSAPITVIQWDGTETILPAKSELAEPLGEMIKAVVLKAREDGLFAPLPKAKGCELGIEHFSGAFAWPEYDDRGEENLA